MLWAKPREVTGGYANGDEITKHYKAPYLISHILWNRNSGALAGGAGAASSIRMDEHEKVCDLKVGENVQMCVTMNFVCVEKLRRVVMHIFREVEKRLLWA